MKPNQDLPFIALWPFLALTFGLSWSVLGFYLFRTDTATAWFGPLSGSHPLFYCAVYAPAFSGLLLSGCRTEAGGPRALLSRLLDFRISRGWLLFLLLGVPLPFFLGAAVEGRLDLDILRLDHIPALLTAMGLMLIKGPVEEIGWRGVALPLLQRRMRPLFAALTLGAIWGVWHYPAFLLSGTPQSAWSFSAFFMGTLALSTIATALFNRTGGSLFFAVVFHFQLINPLWPDGQPADTLFFVVLAVLVTVLNRRAMWNRDLAITTVLPFSHTGIRV